MIRRTLARTTRAFEDRSVRRIFWAGLAVRVPLLIVTPVSLLDDGMQRYIPDSMKLTHLSLGFADPPLYPALLALPGLALHSELLFLVIRLISLAFWALTFREANTLLDGLGVNAVQKARALLIFSFLSWPLLVSVAVLPDTLLAFLFLTLANRVVSPPRRFFGWLEVVLLAVLLVSTNPMGFVMAPSVVVFAWLRSGSRGHALYVAGCYAVGIAAYTPWLIKAKVAENVLVGPALSAGSQASAATPIALAAFPHQAQLAFAYFWEFPSYDKITATHLSQAPLTLLKYVYFGGNIALFVSFTVLIGWAMIRALRARDHIGRHLLVLALCCAAFSVAYWPFFGKYDYWDTGRYTFPVMILILVLIPRYLHFQRPSANRFVGLVICGVLAVSLINASFIVIEFALLQRQVRSVIATPQAAGYPHLVTNDPYTKVYWQFWTGSTVDLDTSLVAASCGSTTSQGSFLICVDNADREVKIIRTGGTSRNTG